MSLHLSCKVRSLNLHLSLSLRFVTQGECRLFEHASSDEGELVYTRTDEKGVACESYS